MVDRVETFDVGRSTRRITSYNVCYTKLLRSTGDTPHSSRLRAVALGSWLASEGRSADVVKMDVEGAELGALAGLWEHGATPPCILLETHAHAFPDVITSYSIHYTKLYEANFSGNGDETERMNLRAPRSNASSTSPEWFRIS